MSDSLKKYQDKRDFSKTKEPKGKVAKRKSAKLKFVVQEHHASHLHYDFRLELDGVLKSWAVPKGPSMNPKDKRLAMQTEDHPLGYEKFEGEIPEGEYGAGEVFLYDKGTWESEVPDPLKALEKGELKFSLKGEKLQGSFVLVKVKYRGAKNSWLLIKHKDEYAVTGKKAAVDPIADYGSRKERPKTLSKKTKKKVHKMGGDPWPGFIKPELPQLVDTAPEGEKWVHEIKFDGYRLQVHLRKSGGIHLFTRNGHDWKKKFPTIAEDLKSLEVTDAIIDGELVSLDKKGRSHFQDLQNSLKEGDDKELVYYGFDLLYLNGRDLRGLPLYERKTLLHTILMGQENRIRFSEEITSSGKDFFEISCEHELEGIISKNRKSTYHSGRNSSWVKVKCQNRQEFVIGGWTDPKGGRQGLGALLVGYWEGNEFQFAGKVGTGFSDKKLKELKKILKPLERNENPFDHQFSKKDGIHFVEPEIVCEVKFANWTNERVLRAPVFIALRSDKKPEEIHRDIPKEVPVANELKLISSPEKVLFEGDGVTKIQVAKYYEEVAPLMLKYMENRPLSLVRCPEGAKKGCFYQKHFTGKTPESFHTFKVKEESGEGIYVSVDSEDGILNLVQLNAFEIHAWNSRQDDYLHADQIIFDLDPGPGVSWKQVIEAAFEVKELLEDLDLKSFVKLTGGKGLHVHVPITPNYSWDEVKSFSLTVAKELESRGPKKYVTNMSKKKRQGKIFIDYLRNGHGATAVVPYSLRAKDKSYVALPVEWTELKRVKGPQQYDLKKALAKIKRRKRDPWQEMTKLSQKIFILEGDGKKEKVA
jgi:bifunctional non-homologous end joining protein LigD